MKLSNLTKEALTKSGWFEGRKCDIAPLAAGYENIDFPLNSHVQRFLVEFYDLDIHVNSISKYFYENTTPKPSWEALAKEIHFRFYGGYDADAHFREHNIPETIRRAFNTNQALGENTSPVGYIGQTQEEICVTADGKFYAFEYATKFSLFLGSSTVEALNCLVEDGLKVIGFA